MKIFYFLFAVGLLACAGSREIDIWDDDPGSPIMIWLGDNTDLPLESQINLPPDSSLTWIDKTICGGGAALGSERGEFIIAAPVSDTSKNRSEDKKPKPFFHKVDTSTSMMVYEGGYNFLRLRDKKALDQVRGNANAQKFSVHVNITFPRMTLQQAAELEARVRKLFPEAQEIDFGLEKKIEAPGESFYYDMPDGVEFRTLPGTLPRVYNTLPFKPGQDLRIEIDSTENVIYFSAPSAPREGLKPGSILKADSTGMPVWREF